MNEEISRSTAAAAVDEERSASATLWIVERDTTTTSYRPSPDRPVPLSAPVRWAIGALVAVGGLLLLVSVAKGGVESTLVDRTEAALASAGLEPSDFDIDFDFRDGTVTGGPLPAGWSAERLRRVLDVEGAGRVVFEPRRSPTSQESDP